MDAPLPTITVIIAARLNQTLVEAVTAAVDLDYPSDRLEILLVRGNQPSAQRNRAVREAKGDWVYFLDDDSVPNPGNLQRVAADLRDPGVKAWGGPNLCPDSAPSLEKAFAGVMGNILAFGPSAARYRAKGRRRNSGEKELILCNLLMRKDAFLTHGGFDEALYPNEENALMEAMQRDGGRLVYDPEFIVHRRPRPDLRSFIRMLLNYGRGRAEQVRRHPGLGSLPNLVPPLFCLYLLLVPWLPRWTWLPLALYAVALPASALATPVQSGASRLAISMGIFATHVFYGIGFWRGLFTQPGSVSSTRPIQVDVQRIPISQPTSQPAPK